MFRIEVAINILFEKAISIRISFKISGIRSGDLLCNSLTEIYYLI
jgi:hypothetical protein